MRTKSGKIYLTQTRNNIFAVFVAEDGGNVVYERSAGKMGYKGTMKRTRLVAETLGQDVGKKVHEQGVRGVVLHLKGGVTPLIRGVIQGIMRSGVEVREMSFLRSIAHNGVRPRKQRRM